MKQKNNKTLWIIVVAVIALVGIFLYTQGTGTDIGSKISSGANNALNGLGLASDRGSNGYWNKDAQQCWPSPNDPQKGTLPAYYCCSDPEGYQVDCQGTKRLSNTQLFPLGAIYFPAGGNQSTNKVNLGISIGFTNTANIDFSKVWIESANWITTPSYIGDATHGQTYVDNAFQYMEGYSNSQAGNLNQGGGTRYFYPASAITLQSLSPDKNTWVQYNGSLVTMGTYLVGNVSTNFSTTSTTSFSVKKEEAGFSVVITLGAA